MSPDYKTFKTLSVTVAVAFAAAVWRQAMGAGARSVFSAPLAAAADGGFLRRCEGLN